MNKTVIAFIIIVLVGLGVAIFLSNRSTSQQTAAIPDVDSIVNPEPTIVVPKVGTPTPTFAPISASTGLIKTAKGDIEVMFYPQDAPRTVTNFATLARNKYYDGLTFHRVEPGFVIQGGDPNGNGSGGQSIYGPTFEDELNPEAETYKAGYLEGTLAMANRGPDTNGSQFFIMWEDKPDLPRNYTIFGKVTKGMNVVRSMYAGDKIISITVQ